MSDRPPPLPPFARLTLVTAILGSAMAFLDGTVVNIALPVMQEDLAATVDQAQWVVEAYALLLASLVLVGGALGDRLGRRRVFVAGVTVFALASAMCGAAPTPALLVAARAAQGAGAALLVPGSLALISAVYPKSERGAAIGTWSAASAMTGAIGPVAAGYVVMRASWRWLFYFNLPLAVLVVVLSRRVPESRDETEAARMDWLGAALATAGLGLVVYGLIGSSAGGIGAPRTLVLVGSGLVTLVVFVVAQARVAHPMVPLALFRSRTFAGTNLLTFLLYAGLGGGFFFLPFNLIQVQRYAPPQAGAALLPFVLLMSVGSRWAGKLAARVGARPLLVAGPAVAALGFVGLAMPGTGGSYWLTFFPPIVVLGAGMTVTVAPLTTAVMGSVDVSHAGVASGINNAVARAAGLLAVAALGVVVLARFDATLDARLASLQVPASVAARIAVERRKLAGADIPSDVAPGLHDALRSAFDDAYVAGFRGAMATSAALALLGAGAAFVLVAPRRRAATSA